MDFLKGTGVAIITPFKKNGEIDFNAYEVLIDFYINNGISYLVILGTTGESHSISLDESSKYLWVLDKNVTDSNYTSHLHFVHILPGHISELINIMIQHNIDFNVFKF